MGWGTSLWMNWKQKKRRDRSHAKSAPLRELLQILFYGNSALFTFPLSAAYIGGKGECNVNVYLFAAVILLLPALCTALGAAGVFLVRRADEPRTRRMLCGMAAGIMLAASVWSLLLPAIERAEAGTLPVWLAPAAGLVLGAVGLLRLEEAAGRLMHTGSKEHGRMGRVVLAVTLHNLPEGMVVGLAAALALRGEPEAVSGALALALGIGLALAWVVVHVMQSQLRSVAFQENAASYVREGSMKLTNQRDLFLYRDVHRTERPKESSSSDSGGSSTHTSSSGTTHGGGGGSF